MIHVLKHRSTVRAHAKYWAIGSIRQRAILSSCTGKFEASQAAQRQVTFPGYTAPVSADGRFDRRISYNMVSGNIG